MRKRKLKVALKRLAGRTAAYEKLDSKQKAPVGGFKQPGSMKK